MASPTPSTSTAATAQSTTSKAWPPEEICKRAINWSLEGDSNLLKYMESMSKNLESRCKRTNANLKTMMYDLDITNIKLANTTTKFLSLNNLKFVEHRVQADVIDETQRSMEMNASKCSEQTNSSNNLSPQSLIQLAVKNSLNVMDRCYEKVALDLDLDSDDDDNPDEQRHVVCRPKNPYHNRPLPLLISSKEWHDKWHIGLVDSDEELSTDSKNEEFSQSSNEEDVASVSMSLPSNAPTMSESDSYSSQANPQQPNDLFHNSNDDLMFKKASIENIRSNDRKPVLPNVSKKEIEISVNRPIIAPSSSIFREQKPQMAINLFDDQPPPALDSVSIRNDRKPTNLFIDSDDDDDDPFVSMLKDQKQPATTQRKTVPDVKKEETQRQPIAAPRQVAAVATKPTTNLFDEQFFLPQKNSQPKSNTNISNLFDDEPPDDLFDVMIKSTKTAVKTNLFDEFTKTEPKFDQKDYEKPLIREEFKSKIDPFSDSLFATEERDTINIKSAENRQNLDSLFADEPPDDDFLFAKTIKSTKKHVPLFGESSDEDAADDLFGKKEENESQRKITDSISESNIEDKRKLFDQNLEKHKTFEEKKNVKPSDGSIFEKVVVKKPKPTIVDSIFEDIFEEHQKELTKKDIFEESKPIDVTVVEESINFETEKNNSLFDDEANVEEDIFNKSIVKDPPSIIDEEKSKSMVSVETNSSKQNIVEEQKPADKIPIISNKPAVKSIFSNESVKKKTEEFSAANDELKCEDNKKIEYDNLDNKADVVDEKDVEDNFNESDISNLASSAIFDEFETIVESHDSPSSSSIHQKPPKQHPSKPIIRNDAPKTYVSFLDDGPPSDDMDDDYNDIKVSVQKNVLQSIGLFDDLPPDDDYFAPSNTAKTSNIFYDDMAETLAQQKSPPITQTNQLFASGFLFNEEPPPDDIVPTVDDENSIQQKTVDEIDHSETFKNKLSIFSQSKPLESREPQTVNRPKPKKLNQNLNINVAALLPGSRHVPSQKQPDSMEEQVDSVAEKAANLKINVAALLPGARHVPSQKQPDSMEEQVDYVAEKAANLKINVAALLPGARRLPSQKQIDVDSESDKSLNFTPTITPVEQNAGRLTSLSKSRARIQVQRRPSTRQARQDGYRKSLLIEEKSIMDESARENTEKVETSPEELFKKLSDDDDDDDWLIAANKKTQIKEIIVQQQISSSQKIENIFHKIEDKRRLVHDIKETTSASSIQRSNSIDGQEENFSEVNIKSKSISDRLFEDLDADWLVSSTSAVESTPPIVAPKKPILTKQLNIFDDEDDDDDLFAPLNNRNKVPSAVNSKTPSSKDVVNSKLNETEKVVVVAKKIITSVKSPFSDDDDDDDDLFGGATNTKKICQNPISNTAKVVEATPKVVPKKIGLFGDSDDDDDIFSSKGSVKSKPSQPPSRTIVEKKPAEKSLQTSTMVPATSSDDPLADLLK